MSIRATYKYAFFAAGITLTTIAAFLLIQSPKAATECFVSEGQSVVRWKNMYYGGCTHAWNGFCIWPIRRPHSTYKITVHEGVPVRNEQGLPVPVAGGKIRAWRVYDAAAWNGFESEPHQRKRFIDYERIADNEYVVLVETRYRLFHNVEATLRLCTLEA